MTYGMIVNVSYVTDLEAKVVNVKHHSKLTVKSHRTIRGNNPVSSHERSFFNKSRNAVKPYIGFSFVWNKLKTEILEGNVLRENLQIHHEQLNDNVGQWNDRNYEIQARNIFSGVDQIQSTKEGPTSIALIQIQGILNMKET